MNTTFQLPKGDEEFASVMWRHAIRIQDSLMLRRTTWLLAWYYLNGYRRFQVFDPMSGEIRAFALDEDGNMEFQSQELLFAINQVAGRIQSMDLRPSVVSSGFSLGAVRSRSIAQVIADAVLDEDVLRKAKDEFSWLFACLGFAGCQGHIVDHATIGLTSDFEIIHPREIFPFPWLGQDHTKLRGIMRQRMVPVDWLIEKYGKEKIENNLGKMQWYTVDPGAMEGDRDGSDLDPLSRGIQGVVWNPGSGGKEGAWGSANPQLEYTRIAKIREVWVDGPGGTVETYGLCSGQFTIDRQDTKGEEIYCPVGWARFMNNGSFHGAGMFDLMYSIHRQLEQLQKQLFNNVHNIDKYGLLVLPQGQFNQNQLLKDVGHGLKVMFWEPDPVNEHFNPFPITPFNSGDMPGRTAQFARESFRIVNPLQDLLQEKGRVDSAAGLQVLNEQITRALTSPTSGVQRAFGSAYRAMVKKATAELVVSRRTIPVKTLSLDLAGAIIDPQDGTVSFKDNPLPSLSGLSFSVRDISPKSEVSRKQEALELWDKKVEQDPMAFRLFAMKEGLDFAIWMDEDKGAFEASIRLLLTLYGDGQTPGEITITPYTTKPEITLRLYTGFTTGPFMQVASVEVINKFRLLRQTLINFMGLTLPNAVPNPDDAAMLQMLMMPGPSEGAPGADPMAAQPQGMMQ